ncbi:FecR family protein [Spirosoma luteolum]
MPDYTHYTFDEFVLDHQFQQWVLKNTPADQVFWNEWLQANPDKVDLVLAARQFVSQMQQAHEELSDEEVASEVARIRDNRQKAQDLHTIPPPRLPTRFVQWAWLAAATVLVGLGTLVYVYTQHNATPLASYQHTIEKQAGTLLQRQNTSNASQLVRLPDGSKVTLYKGSRISFPRAFTANRRDVFLVGEAFFEVVRRPRQPFFVYTHQLTTQVLGTSFTIRAFPDDAEAKVIVRTGKVSVFKTPASGEIGEIAGNEPALILTPNQQATLQASDRQLERSLVALPEPVLSPTSQTRPLVFEHTPVVSVFERLEAAYGIIVNYDAELLAGCELTAEFGSESLFEKLDLICRATNSTYEVVDAQIVIHSKGCR